MIGVIGAANYWLVGPVGHILEVDAAKKLDHRTVGPGGWCG